MVQVQEFHMTITDLHHMVLEEVNHILTQCNGEILGPGHVTWYPSVVMVNIHPTNQVSHAEILFVPEHGHFKNLHISWIVLSTPTVFPYTFWNIFFWKGKNSTSLKLLQRKSARPSFNDKSYLRKVIVDTICCHGILTESLEVDGGPIKGVVVGVPEHQTGPRPWEEEQNQV